MHWIHSLRRAGADAGLLALALVAWAPSSAQAADAAPAPAAAAGKTVVATGPAGDITEAQLEATVEALVPQKDRVLFWGVKDNVIRFVRSLGAQQAIAARAEQAGLRPADAAAQGLKRQQELVKAYLDQQGQAAVPDTAALERYALSEYRAHPERYAVPAQVRVRHIVLPLAKDGSDDAAVKARAEKLLAELRGGADFAALAKAQSADAASAQQGGEMPWFARGQMPAELEAAAFALKQPGALSEPVKTPSGYQIIELLETRAQRELSFDEVRPTLEKEARDRLESTERGRLWTDEQDKVKIDDDALQGLMYRNAAAAQR
ncbi:MAG: peptidylprolyl isomerase [Proteobacteria bacterium]|nr:peptidylprolyl isomerase [Pseudomonadota bacterium]